MEPCGNLRAEVGFLDGGVLFAPVVGFLRFPRYPDWWLPLAGLGAWERLPRYLDTYVRPKSHPRQLETLQFAFGNSNFIALA